MLIPLATRRVTSGVEPFWSGWRLDSVTLLTLLLATLYALPPRLVVAGLGAVGRPPLILGFGLFLWWMLARLGKRLFVPGRQPVRTALFVYLATVLVAYALGFARGLPEDEASGSDRSLILTLSLVGICLAMLDGVTTRGRLDALLRRLLLAAGLMAVIGEVQFLFRVDLTTRIQVPGLTLNQELIDVASRGDVDLARVAGTAGHYIEYGVLLGMLLPLAIHYALYSPHRTPIHRWALVFVLAAGVPFSISRSAVLAAVAGLLVMLIAWTGRRRFNGLAVMFVFLVVLQAGKPGLLGTLKSLFLNAPNDPSVTGRTEDYDDVGRYLAGHEWFGRGPGTFLPSEYILLDNQWLGTLVSVGVVGVVALAGLLLTAFLLAKKVAHEGADAETRHLGHALSATVVVALISSFTFDSLAFSTFAVTLFVLLGAIGALWRLDRAVRESAGPPHSTEMVKVAS